MNWNKVFHIAGGIGCALGVFGLWSYGWQVWQWPAIALIWCISSYTASLASQRWEDLCKQMSGDVKRISDTLVREQNERFKAEFELAKRLDKK